MGSDGLCDASLAVVASTNDIKLQAPNSHALQREREATAIGRSIGQSDLRG